MLANIDCTAEENKALAEKYGVKGFPTIKVAFRRCSHSTLHTCQCNSTATSLLTPSGLHTLIDS